VKVRMLLTKVRLKVQRAVVWKSFCLGAFWRLKIEVDRCHSDSKLTSLPFCCHGHAGEENTQKCQCRRILGRALSKSGCQL
jgi:hypothetical protein